MSTIRVNKDHNFTVMSNYHLRDKQLSNKSKGLLSIMLSLPEEWDYTVRGLAAICKDGVDGITAQLHELEECGYLVRKKVRDCHGHLVDTEYNVYEQPHLDLPDPETPDTVNPDTVLPRPDNPAQRNIDQTSHEKIKTKISNTKSFNSFFAERRADGNEMRDEIHSQIEYDILVERVDAAQLDELVEIMLEVAMNQRPTMQIGSAEYPTDFVQQRFRQINLLHIEKVMDGLKAIKTRVWNTRAYLLASLFNVVSTMDNHYAMLLSSNINSGMSPDLYHPVEGESL